MRGLPRAAIAAALMVGSCATPNNGGGGGAGGGTAGASGRGGAGASGRGGSAAGAGSSGAAGAGSGDAGATAGSGATAGASGGAPAGGSDGGGAPAGGSDGGGARGAAGRGGAGDASGSAGTGGDAGAGGGSAGAAAGGSGGGAGRAAGGSGGGAGTGGPPAAQAWAWVSVVGTGQSLAVGGHGNAAAQPSSGMTQRFHNLKLSLGSANVPPYDANNAALSMVPLTEPLRTVTTGYPSPYPRNIYGQSFHTAMADEITTLIQAALGRDTITAHVATGEAGQPFSVISKGATDSGTTGRAYAASVFEVAAIARLAKAAGKSHGVGAIVLTHGESDAGSATYEADVVKLWSDYNQDLAALTGQTAKIPLIQSQQHSEPTNVGSRSAATLAQWQSGVHHPGDVVCSGPKYQYPYIADAIHLTNPGYDRLGEKTGQVFAERVMLGRDWRPLEPVTVTRTARVITVTFHVPVPPLAWDTTLPMPHQSGNSEWAPGRGFEVWSGSTRVAISAVAIAGDAVQITCASDPPATGLMVGYAAATDGAARSGGSLRWGQLRDSDPFVGSVTGAAQPNYAVAFELPVP
jgi:hypothetical protein